MKLILLPVPFYSSWLEVMSNAITAYCVYLTLAQSSSNDALNIKPLHMALLVQLRRRSLQQSSDLIYRIFEKGEVVSAMKIANTHLVPSLGAFAMSICPGDEDVLEKVREEWCQCLTHPGLTEGIHTSKHR